MPRNRKSGVKASLRAEILRAAEKLVRSVGLSQVTTRQIAEQAGCSEGALYVHFGNRLELLLAMLEESLQDMLGPLEELRQSVGNGSAQGNLVLALSGMLRFYRRLVPVTAALFAEPELLIAYRSSLKRRGKGPHLSVKVLEEYIRAERGLGRVAPDIDARLAAYLLMSATFFRAFIGDFFGESSEPRWEKFAERLVATVAPTTRRING